MANANVTLGQGSYGCVTRRYSTTRGQYVARKQFNNAAYFNEEYNWFKAIHHAAEANGNAHPGISNIVRLLATSPKNSNEFYLELECAEKPLSKAAFDGNHHLRYCPEFPDKQAVAQVITDSLNGLDFLHNVANVNHNDIKPANMLIFANGRVKYCDLGLLSDFGDQQKMGTLGYTAPEVYRKDRESRGRSDVFSLGVTLFLVFEGRDPTPLSNHMLIAFRRWNEANRDNRPAAWTLLVGAAKEFYTEQFNPSVPSGVNVKEIRRSDAHLIAAMCCVDFRQRPTIKQCFELRRAFEVVDKIGGSFQAAARSLTHRSEESCSEFGTLDVPAPPPPVKRITPLESQRAEVRGLQVKQAAAAPPPRPARRVEPAAMAVNIDDDSADYHNEVEEAVEEGMRDKLIALLDAIVASGAPAKFKAQNGEQQRIINLIRQNPGGVLSTTGVLFLQLIFKDTRFDRNRQIVFLNISGRSENFWKKSQEVKRQRYN